MYGVGVDGGVCCDLKLKCWMIKIKHHIYTRPMHVPPPFIGRDSARCERRGLRSIRLRGVEAISGLR